MAYHPDYIKSEQRRANQMQTLVARVERGRQDVMDLLVKANAPASTVQQVTDIVNNLADPLVALFDEMVKAAVRWNSAPNRELARACKSALDSLTTVIEATRVCPYCNRHKLVSEFHVTPTGRSSRSCKECVATRGSRAFARYYRRHGAELNARRKAKRQGAT